MLIRKWRSSAKVGVIRSVENEQMDPRIDNAGTIGRRRKRTVAVAALENGDCGKRTLRAAKARLIAESEAFLSGTYAIHLTGHNDDIPVWARLNTLAHGDIDSLKRAEKSFTAMTATELVRLTEDPWRIPLGILAGEINRLVGDDPDHLTHVQQRALIPLEFRLMRVVGLTPYELLQLTRAAMRSSIS